MHKTDKSYECNGVFIHRFKTYDFQILNFIICLAYKNHESCVPPDAEG